MNVESRYMKTEVIEKSEHKSHPVIKSNGTDLSDIDQYIRKKNTNQIT